MAFSMGEKIRKIEIKNAVKVNYKKAEYSFEILAKPNAIEKIKSAETDKDISGLKLEDILVVSEIYLNADAGNIAKKEGLTRTFGTENKREIAIIMIKEGIVEITVEQKRKIMNQKLAQLVTAIQRNAVDSVTKTIIPTERIELAIDQVNFKIDLYQPLEKQIQVVVKKIQPILPLSFEKIKLLIVISPEYAPRSYGILKKFQSQKFEYRNDGSLEATVELTANQKIEFLSQINKLTKGSANITEIS
ncbi:MAG: ribosome assembly factor SBDS [Candidatus Huberarchaeum crystalense]|uniref:Ribosome assembly factor SBDS n=1 Tax=Huberarchaeum crystalense TaxID=2014257 RepID=A0A2G9LJX3_HUBC1|nr:ribosome assembly factor SBDS [archaeon]PIN66480.1 MAG: ribosome assembly factor SBDS [Candidatus Huberarchaeum crystalense]PIV13829.1 MAG: ribosome assembly factor SBDS [Candidatus Huberarchaeum crystalense]PIV46285.1 MAG: ribosome assembly factor SBDS [Candidatus Huberarchaeum crystalense]PIV89760.1 MAG: ribosome assembly factor SBDS [Candidatus Huberarchaeum crystalense]